MLKKIALILAILFFAGTFASHVSRAQKKGFSDFHCFYTAGTRFAAKENIYVVRDATSAEFRYAPLFALFMSGLARFSERTADTLWCLINYLFLFAALFYLKKLVIGPDTKLSFKQLFFIYALTLLISLRFILHNLDTGQSNLLMLASIIAGLYYITQKKELLGTALFALGCLIKYTPLIFILYFLLRRRFRLSLYICGFIAVYLLLPALFVGWKTNILYLKNLFPILTGGTIFDQMTVLDPKNQSLFSAVNRIFTNCVLYFYAPPMPFSRFNLSPQAINLVFIAIAVVLYSAALFKKGSPLINYALLLICVCLFNLNAWVHGFIFLMPAYFILIFYLVKNNFRDKLALALVIISIGLNSLTSKAFFGKDLAYKLHFYSPFTLAALIIFCALLTIGAKLEETRA